MKGMEALVLAIGSCHGDAVDKFGTIPGLGALPMAALASTAPGRPSSAKRSRADARAVEDSVPASPCAAACDHGVYVAGCVAVMSCSVRDVRPISGHLLCTCVVDAGFVDPRCVCVCDRRRWRDSVCLHDSVRCWCDRLRVCVPCGLCGELL